MSILLSTLTLLPDKALDKTKIDEELRKDYPTDSGDYPASSAFDFFAENKEEKICLPSLHIKNACAILSDSTWPLFNSKKRISRSEFILEMATGLYRGLLRIRKDIQENIWGVASLIGGVGLTTKYCRKSISSAVLTGSVFLGMGVSSYYTLTGIYQGWSSYKNDDYKSLMNASTQFGVGAWGLGFTFLGMKLGAKILQSEDGKNMGGLLAFLLHSGDEIVGVLAIGKSLKEMINNFHFSREV